MTRMRVGTKIDTIYLSILKLSESNNNFKNLPTKNITRRDYSYKLRARKYKFFQKRYKKFGFYKKPKWIPTGTTNQLAICDDLGGTKYE